MKEKVKDAKAITPHFTLVIKQLQYGEVVYLKNEREEMVVVLGSKIDSEKLAKECIK